MSPTPNPVKEVIVVESYVWCETEGDVHEATEDPFHYGPQYPDDSNRADPDYVERTGHRDWPGTLMYYVCPGPHFVLFSTHDVPVDRLPDRGGSDRLELDVKQ